MGGQVGEVCGSKRRSIIVA